MAKKQTLFLVSFLAVPVLLAIMFIVYPLISLGQLSLVKWDGIDPVKEFVGLKNFVTVFRHSPEVWISLKNNLLYFIFHGLLIPVQLVTAVILSDKLLKFSGFFKTVTFMPYIINGVAVAYTFSYFFSPVNGALNGILQSLNMDWAIQRWLSDAAIVNYTLVFVSMWKFFGFGVIIYIAAIKSIPYDQVEAAQIDGANRFAIFWHIYAPGVRRITEILIFLNIKGALTVFDIPFVMTNGGPAHASSTFTLLSLETAFNFNNFGLASAMGIVLMFITITISLAQQKLFSSKGD